MHDVALRIAKDLHFEMAGMVDQPLQHEPVIAESVLCLAPRRRKLLAVNPLRCGPREFHALLLRRRP